MGLPITSCRLTLMNPAHNRWLDRIKREQESATTFEAVAREWFALKDWEVTKDRRLVMLERAKRL